MLINPAQAEDSSSAPPTLTQPAPLALRPAEMMAAMAAELDRNGNVVVLMLADKPITQADMADVVRTMPNNFASLGFEAVSRRALDVLVSQRRWRWTRRRKVSTRTRQSFGAARLRSNGHWPTKHGNAAVTDEALHARYDRDIAGKPARRRCAHV
jgi:hypothetical protein